MFQEHHSQRDSEFMKIGEILKKKPIFDIIANEEKTVISTDFQSSLKQTVSAKKSQTEKIKPTDEVIENSKMPLTTISLHIQQAADALIKALAVLKKITNTNYTNFTTFIAQKNKTQIPTTGKTVHCKFIGSSKCIDKNGISYFISKRAIAELNLQNEELLTLIITPSGAYFYKRL